MMQLLDPYNRVIKYLRLSVTDRCDLRCSYCIPKGFRGFKRPPHWLDFDEIERLLQVMSQLGLQRVRLTGGEPLLRKGLADLAARISAIEGIDDLSLSTNATQLNAQADALYASGIRRINVSLDSLDRQRFARITGRDTLHVVLDGLQQARAIGFEPIKINMVVMKDVNDMEVDSMVGFCMHNNFVLRMIEVMPMGDTGRQSQFVDLQPIARRLQTAFGLVEGIVPGGGPARYLQSADGRFSLGFITPLSQHFCATCNRVRLAVDGTLYLCLGQEDKYEFRDLLRKGVSDAVLTDAVLEAIAHKPERHEFREQPAKILRFMNMTGG
ncbi:MAG: GTP 3',8-cyclase MoaA [Gammaproteobacteria bacterium]|nr:GTP 3',8-cyclase MoaA [Gammaproteobacteria bacterium]